MGFEFLGLKKKVSKIDKAGLGLIAAGAVLGGAAGYDHTKVVETPTPSVGAPSAETSMPTAIHSSDAAPKAPDFQVDTAAALNNPHNDLER